MNNEILIIILIILILGEYYLNYRLSKKIESQGHFWDDLELEKIQSELTKSQQELTNAKELLSIYQSSDALSFFNTEPELVVKILQQHPKNLYYLFYSTDSEKDLDLSSLASNLEDNCLFFGTFGNGKLTVKVNKSQAQVLNFRTAKPIEELFGFTKNKIFISDSTKLFSEGEFLILSSKKGKTIASTSSFPQPDLSPSPTLEDEKETKKKKKTWFITK